MSGKCKRKVKLCAAAAPNHDVGLRYDLAYFDIRQIRIMRDEQREVVRRCIMLYRLWREAHRMLTQEFEKIYSYQKGLIYAANIREEYMLYRRMVCDYRSALDVFTSELKKPL